MKLYHIEKNGALDLEHLMFVGDLFLDRARVDPWVFHIQLAFDVDRHICFDNKAEAEKARAALIEAWESK